MQSQIRMGDTIQIGLLELQNGRLWCHGSFNDNLALYYLAVHVKTHAHNCVHTHTHAHTHTKHTHTYNNVLYSSQQEIKAVIQSYTLMHVAIITYTLLFCSAWKNTSTHTHACVHAHTHACTHMWECMCTQTHTHAHTHTHTHTHIQTNMHTCTHACTNICTHTHAHTHTHTHAGTHMHKAAHHPSGLTFPSAPMSQISMPSLWSVKNFMFSRPGANLIFLIQPRFVGVVLKKKKKKMLFNRDLITKK